MTACPRMRRNQEVLIGSLQNCRHDQHAGDEKQERCVKSERVQRVSEENRGVYHEQLEAMEA